MDYTKFAEYMELVCSKDLDFFIFEAKYTWDFNTTIKKLMEDLESEGLNSIDLAVVFNASNEISIIGSEIIAKYLCDNYVINLKTYYKSDSIERIIMNVIEGNNNAKKDFIKITYSILYNCLDKIYKDLKYNKGIFQKYMDYYSVDHEKNSVINVLTIIMLEDVCQFIKAKEGLLMDAIIDIKTFSQGNILFDK